MYNSDHNISDPVGKERASELRRMLAATFQGMFPEKHVIAAEDYAGAQDPRPFTPILELRSGRSA